MKRPFAFVLAGLMLGVSLIVSGQASDTVISQRVVPVCGPASATPYLYYAATDGKWHCTAAAPRTGSVPLGAAATSTLGTLIGGFTDVSNVASGTVQNTEYTLNSITVPASALNANGRAFEVETWGTLAANANAKNVKIYLGSAAVATVTGTTANAKDYRATLKCVRTAANTQSCIGTITVDTGTSSTWAVAAPTQTDGSAIVVALKTANTAAAAASATGKGMIGHFIN